LDRDNGKRQLVSQDEEEVEEVNLDKLTPEMWNVIRTWEYESLIKASMMLQPIEEEEY
jgi:hypothetical protein